MNGTFVLNSCPVFTDALSHHLDFLIFDREHGLHSFQSLFAQVRTAERRSETWVRVSGIDRVEAQRTLELAPKGILFPQVSSVEAAKKAVSYCQFPPEGVRGVSPFTSPYSYSPDDLAEKKNADG